MHGFPHTAPSGSSCPLGQHVRTFLHHPSHRGHLFRHQTAHQFAHYSLKSGKFTSFAQTSSSNASAEARTSRQGADSRRGAESLTQSILSDPDIEGDPLKFLKVSEAFWQARPTAVHPHATVLDEQLAVLSSYHLRMTGIGCTKNMKGMFLLHIGDEDSPTKTRACSGPRTA